MINLNGSYSERTIEFLSRYRPLINGQAYRAISMTPDEIAERRAYIRQKLRMSSFNNLSNDTLDQCLYYELDGMRFFEDEKGYCYALKAERVSAEQGDFRKSRAMIPFEYIGLKTHDFKWDVYSEDTTKAKDILNRYLLSFPAMKEKGMGLYICSGTKGSGKTMLSCCIINEIADKYTLNIKFINVLDLLELTKKSYKGDDTLQTVQNAVVLVIDDIGVQLSREWTDTVLYRLINERYANHRVTIYTSNLKIDDLKIDERIKDRIEATSYIVNLPETPVRKNKSEADKNKLMDDLMNKNAPNGAATPSQGNVTH